MRIWFSATNFQNHILINPDVRLGKPCIKGTRIAAVDILGWLAAGMTRQKVLEDFSSLKEEYIFAALAFTARREQITLTN